MFFTLARRFWNQIWIERSDMPSSRDSCSRTLLFGDGLTLNVFSRTASCSGVARVRLRGGASCSFGLVLVGVATDGDDDCCCCCCVSMVGLCIFDDDDDEGAVYMA